MTKTPASNMRGSRNSGSTVRAMLRSWRRHETKIHRAAVVGKREPPYLLGPACVRLGQRSIT